MPLKKKYSTRNKIMLAVAIVVLLALIFVYIAPIIHTTEIVLFP